MPITFSESVQSNLCVLQSKPVSIDRSHFFVKKFLTRFLLASWYAAGKYTRPFSRKDGKTAHGRDSTLLLRAPTGMKQSEHEIRNQQKQLPPQRRCISFWSRDEWYRILISTDATLST